LSPAQLVEVIVQQQLTIVQQQRTIEQLRQEILKLKGSLKLDSKNSSKPPSTDLLKKPEKNKEQAEQTTEAKRNLGGQPGHAGKTHKPQYPCR
jgi:transposase